MPIDSCPSSKCPNPLLCVDNHCCSESDSAVCGFHYSASECGNDDAVSHGLLVDDVIFVSGDDGGSETSVRQTVGIIL